MNTKNIEWSSVLENMLKDLGEKAFSYSYLHKASEAHYSKKRNYTDLPVIVLSTISGTLSIGSSSIFPENFSKEGSVAIGMLSLFVATLNTIGTYFSFAKRSEAHRLCAIEYSKLFRFIDIELSLPRKERMTAKDILKVVRENYERLAEIAPLIPESIIKNYNKSFKDTNVAKPSEVNGLESIKIYTPDQITPLHESHKSIFNNGIDTPLTELEKIIGKNNESIAIDIPTTEKTEPTKVVLKTVKIDDRDNTKSIYLV